MTKILSAIALLCIATLLLTLPAIAQTSTTGAIVGRAQDATGAVIPGVEVSISSPAMIGGTKSQVTDEQGVYRFELLVPGTYKISFALPGFKTLNVTDVIVQPNLTMTENGTMEVSSTAEEVTVTSEAPAIDLEAATVGVTWNQKMITELPWSRSLVGISSMLPGTYATSYDIGNASFGTTSGITATNGGLTSSRNAVVIDGLQWCQTYENWGAFEEVAVATTAKGADAFSPGIITTLNVKTGSNMYHGQVTANYQNGSMQSNNVDSTLLAEGYPVGSNKFTHFDEYYGDIGGPVFKDKLWFYFDARQAFQGTYVPGFLTAVGGSPAVFSTVLRGPDAKLTYQLTPKQKIDAYWGLPDKHQPYRGGSALQPADAGQNQDSWSGQGPILTWTDIIDAKTTAQVKLARGGYWWPAYAYSLPSGLGPSICVANCATTAGGGPGGTFETLPTLTTFGVPNVGVHISDTTSGAVDGSYDTNYTRPIRWQWTGDFSRVVTVGGKANELKVGYMGWWDKDYTLNFQYPYEEAYIYKSLSSEACPQAVICNTYFLHPYEFSLYDAPYSNNVGGKYQAFYVNDKITLSRKLTVNVGVRFDRATSFLDPQGNPGVGPFSIQYEIPYDGYNNTGTLYTFPVYTLWSPRLSFAYDVFGNGKMAVKASYGRYIDMTSSPASQPGPGATTSGIDPISERTCTYKNWTGAIPIPQSVLTADFGPDGIMGNPDNVNLTAACPGSGSNGTHTFNSGLNPNYLDEFAAGVEVGLNRNNSVRVNFQRKFDHQSVTEAVNVLTPYSAYTAATCQVDNGPLANGTGGVGNVCIYAVPNTGNSAGLPANPNFSVTDVNYQNTQPGEDVASYTAFDFTYSKAYANHWQFLAGFNIDEAHAAALNPLTPNLAIQNAQNVIPAWDRSFHMNGVYEIPGIPTFVHGFKINGVQWSSNFIAQSGNWYSRSIQVKDANGTTQTIVVNGHFGRYPETNDWDQRITKNFRFKDRYNVQVRWDLYNIMNFNTVQGYRSTVSTASTYLQPNGTPLIPASILSPRIQEWGVSFKF